MVRIAVASEMFHCTSMFWGFFYNKRPFCVLPTDIFLPTPDSLLVNLHESKEVQLLKIFNLS